MQSQAPTRLRAWPLARIPRPNNGLAPCLQLSQLQVEIKQVGQYVILGAPAVGLEHQGIKGNESNVELAQVAGLHENS